jgi:hypothetical protein
MRSLRGRQSIVVLACAAALAAGCGGDDGDEPAGTDLTALRCPLVEVNGSFRPADGAFDTAELIGMSLDDARARAAENGCEVVVSLEDGKGRPVPIDVDPKRIYVYTEDGVVSEIEGVGGGL